MIFLFHDQIIYISKIVYVKLFFRYIITIVIAKLVKMSYICYYTRNCICKNYIIVYIFDSKRNYPVVGPLCLMPSVDVSASSTEDTHSYQDTKDSQDVDNHL